MLVCGHLGRVGKVRILVSGVSGLEAEMLESEMMGWWGVSYLIAD